MEFSSNTDFYYYTASDYLLSLGEDNEYNPLFETSIPDDDILIDNQLLFDNNIISSLIIFGLGMIFGCIFIKTLLDRIK